MPPKFYLILKYSSAIFAVAIELLLRIALWQWVGSAAPYSVVFVVVLLVASYAGTGPGIVAAIAGGASVVYFLEPPRFSFMLTNRNEYLGLVLYAATSGMIIAICRAWRLEKKKSRENLERAAQSTREAEAAREREASILNSLGEAFSILDFGFRFTYVNEPAIQNLQRPLDELIGHSLWDLFPDLKQQNIYEMLLQTMNERVPTHFEMQYPPFDRWFEFDVYPSPEGIAISTRDITERKRLEGAVRESEQRFRLMADAAPVLIWTARPDKLCFYFNQPWLNFTGRTFEQEVGNGWMEGIHSDDAHRVLETFVQCFDAREQFFIEYRFRHHDGDYRWMLNKATPRVTSAGEFAGYIGTCIDIHDRKKFEEELRESEAQLRLALDASRMGNWSRDVRSGKIVWSPELEAIFGLEPGTFSGTDEAYYGFILPEYRDYAAAVVRKAVNSGTDYEMEFRFTRADGQIRWMLGRGRAFYDADGEPVRLVGVGIDITERKRHEERFLHSQKLESLGILAGGIAHDFNNLLTGIMGGASLVLEDLEPQTVPWNVQKNVLDAAEKAAKLTHQMLAYSGKGRFFVERIDLVQYVREITPLLDASIPKKVSLVQTPSTYECCIEGDPAQIQQVIMNLVINAAEAIGAENAGQVVISIRVQDADEAYIQALPAANIAPGKYVVLEIHDTGAGMDALTRARIFDPFFTTKFTGRGLGLAAVQGIVSGHKGAIQVYSEPGAGTTFKVLFPVAAAAEELADEPADWGHAPRGAATVLVIDDEEVVRQAARSALERFGYQVIVAADGEEGVRLFRERSSEISLILLDMTMPVLSGEEALPRLLQIQPGARVVVSSGYSEVEAERRFADARLSGFIQKPYSALQLARCVDKALSEPTTELSFRDRATIG